MDTYYRPKWTCGRYNKEAKVAIYYNLIEGMSYFFESDSAEVVSHLLAVPRNNSISVDTLSKATDTATECLIPFLDELVVCGLLTHTPVTSKGIKSYRSAIAKYKCTIDTLLDDIEAGRKYMKVYKQMKMYNDKDTNPVLYAGGK